MSDAAGSRYGEWNGTVIGRKRFTNLDLRWVKGIFDWSSPVGALTLRRARLRPYRDWGGPVTTMFRAPFTSEILICLSGGRWVFVLSTWLCTAACERSR